MDGRGSLATGRTRFGSTVRDIRDARGDSGEVPCSDDDAPLVTPLVSRCLAICSWSFVLIAKPWESHLACCGTKKVKRCEGGQRSDVFHVMHRLYRDLQKYASQVL